MKCAKILFTAGIVLVFCSTIWADVPRLINFQGRLTDGSGTPVKDSTYSVLFTIYDAFIGGTNLWSETQSVATKGGTFNVNLGSSTALPDTIFNDTTRYLAMKVGTDPEMTPRQRIVSMAYGYRVRTVDGATGGTISGDVNIQSDLYVDGNVGIGTTAPSQKLYVKDGRIGAGDGTNEIVMELSGTDGILSTGGMGVGLSIQSYFATPKIYLDDTNSEVEITGGNVGIGTTSPAQKLDVVGTAQVTGFKMPTGATSSYVLTSDASGVGTWQSAPGGISGSGTSSYISKFTAPTSLGNSVLYESGGNVGIGTTSPNEQLQITGNLRLPASTASVGVIKSGANRFIHNFGTDNFFAGVNAGNLTTSGVGANTGVGANALQALTTGYSNTAMGRWALYSNTTGFENTAVGWHALVINTTGNYNTAMGMNALPYNTTGNGNTAVGASALYSSTGTGNTAVGASALFNNTTGTNNTAIGYDADVGGGGLTNATAIGFNAVVAASNALVLGGTGAYAVNVGIGTTTPQGALDVVSTTGALIVPRMTTVQRDALTAVNGMIIYNTTTNQFNFREAGVWVIK